MNCFIKMNCFITVYLCAKLFVDLQNIEIEFDLHKLENNLRLQEGGLGSDYVI